MTRPDELWTVTTGGEDAPRVILVHGTLDRSTGLARLARRLGDEFSVTRYDRRGYGKSSGAPGPYTVDANVDDLVAIIESDPAPVHLFGHSFGGNVCLAAAERLPDRVGSVVVYESPLSWRPDWERSTPSDPAAWRDDPSAVAEAFMRRLLGDRRWERLPPATRAARRAEGATMVAELTDLEAAAPWDPDRISVPVVPMYGEFGLDRHRDAMATIAAEIATSAPAIEVKAANHFGPNTRAADVADAIRSAVGAA